MTYAPGSIVLCHSRGIISALIRFGQWIRHPRRTRFYEWNHVGILNHQTSDGDWVVIEATARGVTSGYLSTIAPGGRYEVVALPLGVDAAKVLAFARAQVGVRYGFVTIASIALNLLTPSFFRLDVRRSGTWICSALGATSMLAGGWLHPVRDYYQITPAEVAEALDAANSTQALASYLIRKH